MFATSIKTNICVCGAGWGAIAALEGLALTYSDVVVVTDDENVIEYALNIGLRVCSDIVQVDAELYLCAGYTKIIKKEFLECNSVINIHYSLLPKYRGLHSTVWAVLNDEPYFGLTIHEMNQFIDDGPILYQYIIQNNGQTSLDVMEACNRHIAQNLSVIIDEIKEGALMPIEQNISEATWVCRRNLDDCLIDFDQGMYRLRLLFRALVEPYPLPRVSVGGRIVEIVKSELVDSNYFMHNGRVVNVQNEVAWIKVEEGFLVVSSIRDAATKADLSVSSVFKLGQRLKC